MDLAPGRIVLATFGSYGDLHPYLALAIELKGRGHEVVVATHAAYRQKVETLGITFHPVRPELPDGRANPAILRRVMDARTGSECVVRELTMPYVRESYEDLEAASQGAGLIVSHPLTFAVRLLAEKTGIRWVSSVLSPIGFFSSSDPPVVPNAPPFVNWRFLGSTLHRAMFGIGRWSTRSWCAPWHALRASLGLPPTDDNPLFEGQHAPGLVLALFSPQLAGKQHDWPPQTLVTGFPFFDEDGEPGLSPALSQFLDNGPPPIVFTLGSAAVMDAGNFYEVGAAAAERLGRRAVLLVGRDIPNRPEVLPDGVAAFDYAPYSQLFPRAEVIVHQGGVGTTGQAMRSGRPMLVMPYAHDQPDNAARVTRLGIALTIARREFEPVLAARELARIIDEPAFVTRANRVGHGIAWEDGAKAASDALERMLRT